MLRRQAPIQVSEYKRSAKQLSLKRAPQVSTEYRVHPRFGYRPAPAPSVYRKPRSREDLQVGSAPSVSYTSWHRAHGEISFFSSSVGFCSRISLRPQFAKCWLFQSRLFVESVSSRFLSI